jgi:hypothetical protein
MNDMLEPIEIGGAGYAYLLHHLDKIPGLCAGLKGLIGNTPGRVIAPLPKSTSIERARQIEAGGIINESHASWVRPHLLALARNLPSSTLILQDVWLKPSDVMGLEFEAKHVLTLDNVYYYVSNPKDSESIGRVFKSVVGLHFIGAFISRSIDLEEIHKSEMTDADFEDLATYALEIYARAYDGESMVIWQRLD